MGVAGQFLQGGGSAIERAVSSIEEVAAPSPGWWNWCCIIKTTYLPPITSPSACLGSMVKLYEKRFPSVRSAPQCLPEKLNAEPNRAGNLIPPPTEKSDSISTKSFAFRSGAS